MKKSEIQRLGQSVDRKVGTDKLVRQRPVLRSLLPEGVGTAYDHMARKGLIKPADIRKG